MSAFLKGRFAMKTLLPLWPQVFIASVLIVVVAFVRDPRAILQGVAWLSVLEVEAGVAILALAEETWRWLRHR
jgi:hypothetical protein